MFHKHLEKITFDDLASPAMTFEPLRDTDGLLDVVADTIVELIYIWRINAECVAMAVCDGRPELEKRYGWDHIQALAGFLLAAEIRPASARFQSLFDYWNDGFFSNRLPRYCVRVVFDIHTFADEPVPEIGACSGLIRFAERCIYIRHEEERMMQGMLVHEMAHAATNGEHDEPWNAEMRRLSQAGAPALDFDFD